MQITQVELKKDGYLAGLLLEFFKGVANPKPQTNGKLDLGVC
jgi:hypothetical protein